MHYIEELQQVIRNLHGCESQYVETVPVTETFQGETIWQGDVEVFEIRGHPTATHAGLTIRKMPFDANEPPPTLKRLFKYPSWKYPGQYAD